MTAGTRRASFHARIARALHDVAPGDYHRGPSYECPPCQERAAAVMAVRDAELDRALNQVRDYERQIETLTRDLGDALADITRITLEQQPASTTKEH